MEKIDRNVEKIDRKFRFVGFNPSKPSSVVTEDDAVVFKAADRALPDTLRFYQARCEQLGADPKQVEGIALLIGRVQRFQQENVRSVRVADVDDGPEAAAVLRPNE